MCLEGGSSRNNPYANSETEVTHREYHNLHTGTYQKYGDESIHMSYTSSVKEIKFPSDQLTYFHIPHIITPYTSLNINDTTIAKSGAVGGDVPIKSDKVL